MTTLLRSLSTLPPQASRLRAAALARLGFASVLSAVHSGGPSVHRTALPPPLVVAWRRRTGRGSPPAPRRLPRYSGASLGYQLASITAGGPAPIVAVWLVHTFGTSTAVAGYVAATALVSLVCVGLLEDRAGRLDHD